jgi:GMP synthase (glutamine-hydrolysing)
VRVLAITHGPLVRPELFGEVVSAAGHDLVEWDIVTRGRPQADGFGAVMVFGGVMNVGEEVANPWLHDEYDLLRTWVSAGTAVLGVCLGAQTLAHAAGALVAPAPERYAGFYETVLTPAGAADPVVGVLPERFEALNANGYRFDVPEGAVTLAEGPVPQAYRLAGRAWGVQFHPEVRREQVLTWWREREELPKPFEELERDVDEKLATWQGHGRRLAAAFLAAAARE